MNRINNLRELMNELALEGGDRYKEVLDLAIYDDLTHLYNRRYFMMRLQEEVEKGERHASPFSLLMIDIDNFKDVNDHYGHPIGDEALKELGQLMKREVRTIDIVSRFGGEEYAIILTETDEQEAIQVAQRLLTAVRSQVYTTKAIAITCSVGLAVYPQHGNLIEVLLVQVDNALYQAKLLGKDRLSISSTDLPNEYHYKTRRTTNRAIIHDLTVRKKSEGTITVTVELVFNSIPIIGKTSGRENKLLSLTGEAVILALEQLLPKDVTINLEDIREVRIGEEKILTSFVRAQTASEKVLLVGAVFVSHDYALSAIKVVLDALNRYISGKIQG